MAETMKEAKTNTSEPINQEQEIDIKIKGRGSTFFGIIFHYLRRHLWIGFAIVFITGLSAATTVVGPKIIQNIMGNLMAPAVAAGVLVTFLETPEIPKTIESFNSLLEKGGSQAKISQGLFDKLMAAENQEAAVDIIKDSTGYYTTLGSLELNWNHWIYIQLGLFAALAIFTYFSNWLAGLMGKNIEIELRNKALERLVKQDMSYYSDKKIGEILTKIVSDTQIIGEQAQQIPVTMLSAVFTFFGSLGMLCTIDLKLTGVLVALMATILIIMFSTFGIVKKLVFKVRDSITSINGDVTDRIATVRLIKASGTELYETERFKEIHKDYYKKSSKLITMQSTVITVMVAGISSIQMVIVIAAAFFYNDQPQILAVTLSSFISGVGTMVGPIMQLARVTAGLVQASTASARIDQIIRSKSRIDSHYNPEEGIHIDKIDGDITLKGVEFRYPEKPEKVILPKFDFTFKHGKSYAFVGETGAGKSTIAKMLLRFYDPSEGQVLINGNIDLKDIQLSSYLEKVGYVEQEPQILFGTVLDNIKYGRFDATDEEAIEAAKKAELDSLVRTWPEGYDTVLGERGFMLSGGQKQRLVIARMILKDPEVLILDEATSALDNIVEKEIQAELDKLMKGRTTVSIAHRLSTIKNCDQIIVLARDKGVAQVGTFEELKNKDGHFKKLYEAGLME
ncbi:ABC transporter ATP-binding protein [Spiroplasma culicicola]|uniref:ABC transporter ATP-binding protein n=1 Tax=Spiroplasma culicicola AES-1 TaxID=1276246 RepID=W6A6V4_9MOLU|nr:ABC transporter ATP-binding protein [Spiroplasma culicicola]AHI52691.1 ABC transporter ATP-binding protein [Spiroplasma culicicola AES-1]